MGLGVCSQACRDCLSGVYNRKEVVLIIDNYDSFVYNLAQYVGKLGWQPLVFRNDALTLKR